MNQWESIKLEVLTPMFMGGAGANAELRVPSMRGTFRFWLRTLVGGIVENDLDALGQIESAVFGSTEKPSPIHFRIRTDDQPEIRRASFDNYGEGIRYLLGQGLKGQSYIVPGTEFELLVRRSSWASDDVWLLARAAIWLALECGGFGAHSSRGWGSLKSVESESTLSFPVQDNALALVALGGVNDETNKRFKILFTKEVKENLVSPVTRLLNRTPNHQPTDRPQYPAFADGFFVVQLGNEILGNWEEAMEELGKAFKEINKNTTTPKHDRGALGLPRGEDFQMFSYTIRTMRPGPPVKPTPVRWPSQLRFKLQQTDKGFRPLTVVTQQETRVSVGEATSRPSLKGFSDDSIERVTKKWFRQTEVLKETNPTP